MQEIGKKSHKELSKVIPSFIRRSDPAHKHHQAICPIFRTDAKRFSGIRCQHAKEVNLLRQPGVRFTPFRSRSPRQSGRRLFFMDTSAGLKELQEYCSHLPDEECPPFETASSSRENRRHKSPRALEHANFTFEILADFGVYRDLPPPSDVDPRAATFNLILATTSPRNHWDRDAKDIDEAMEEG